MFEKKLLVFHKGLFQKKPPSAISHLQNDHFCAKNIQFCSIFCGLSDENNSETAEMVKKLLKFSFFTKNIDFLRNCYENFDFSDFAKFQEFVSNFPVSENTCFLLEKF